MVLFAKSDSHIFWWFWDTGDTCKLPRFSMMKPFLSPESLLMSRCVIFDSNVFQVPEHSIPPATPSLKQSSLWLPWIFMISFPPHRLLLSPNQGWILILWDPELMQLGTSLYKKNTQVQHEGKSEYYVEWIKKSQQIGNLKKLVANEHSSLIRFAYTFVCTPLNHFFTW